MSNGIHVPPKLGAEAAAIVKEQMQQQAEAVCVIGLAAAAMNLMGAFAQAAATKDQDAMNKAMQTFARSVNVAAPHPRAGEAAIMNVGRRMGIDIGEMIAMKAAAKGPMN